MPPRSPRFYPCNSTVISTGLVSYFVEFVFSDASPMVLATLEAGDVVLETELAIETVFDDPVAELSIGFPGDPDALLAAADVDTSKSLSAGSDRNLKLAGTETLSLFLSPGASTQGSGSAQVLVRRA